MKRRGLAAPDSLELLLDTICNVFGGIILIAILVALLSRDVRVVTDSDRMRRLSSEMIERKIAIAEQDALHASQLNSDLKAKLKDPDLVNRVTMANARLTLQADAASLTSVENGLDDSIKLLHSLDSQSPDEKVTTLTQLVNPLLRQQTEEQNNIAAAKQNIERLSARLADLDKQTQHEREKRFTRLRLPKESMQTKTSFHVIVRYGQVYFNRDPTKAGMPRNEVGLTWEEKLFSDKVEVKPIRGRGLDPIQSAAQIANCLNSIRRDQYYIVCWVYSDSFSAFNEFKKNIVQWRLDYGWEPCTPDTIIIQSTDGPAPPPPL